MIQLITNQLISRINIDIYTFSFNLNFPTKKTPKIIEF